MKKLLLMLFLMSALLIAMGSSAVAFKNNMSLDEIQKMAEQGDPSAQVRLGVAYSTGTGVDADLTKALEWYQKAADQGSPQGQWNLAWLYVKGKGVEESYDKALELFQKAADQGLAAAQYDLGMMHFYGMGVARSRSNALKWFHKSADQGYQQAIGFLREQGEYTEPSAEKSEASEKAE
ncbi:MAG: sel1 repeat family protein [Desulfuromonas sp.]|nr:MAG: sel1 repeat family protein [Desulfuromonas sp.]